MPDMNMEKVDVAALEKLISDIGEFNEAMGNILILMSRCVDNMQNVWNDDQYQQFSLFMGGTIDSLRKDLQAMDGTKTALQEMHTIIITE